MLLLSDIMKAVLWEVGRRDKVHLVCIEAETWTICRLVPQQRAMVTDSIAQAAEGAACVETLDTTDAFVFLYFTPPV